MGENMYEKCLSKLRKSSVGNRKLSKIGSNHLVVGKIEIEKWVKTNNQKLKWKYLNIDELQLQSLTNFHVKWVKQNLLYLPYSPKSTSCI